ncbi:MAG TPA: nuclear transport factor 2 family protein [Chryseolinea sp.]|nr:nuclear transport factor 2 family protein [Chryseolinea sp.]
MRINIFFLAAGIFIFSNQVVAQTNPQDLTKTIAEMDSLLFYAFNTCDINMSKSLFTEDLEFYHDAGGLTNYSQNVNLIIQRCSRETKVRRELVDGSLEVFPIKDFGAIQIGSHRFYYTEKGHEEKLDGTFKFIHIWKNVNGDWKISRVISYDH